ncbi:hypothetical protein K470DRAFT_262442 [Piedraia hortae CBS 480.64]|uniref:Uncharacterized protein n=1 Tax=Piedraia hortae CBS 480.64 TaxID=1314780 RepID=A0A6A7C6R8_9PEZI|nr:hypothetical protein K470DRAFT_262442 [Piedraia hortae CBS 480.64]
MDDSTTFSPTSHKNDESDHIINILYPNTLVSSSASFENAHPSSQETVASTATSSFIVGTTFNPTSHNCQSNHLVSMPFLNTAISSSTSFENAHPSRQNVVACTAASTLHTGPSRYYQVNSTSVSGFNAAHSSQSARPLLPSSGTPAAFAQASSYHSMPSTESASGKNIRIS